jgi:hypothetical protein
MYQSKILLKEPGESTGPFSPKATGLSKFDKIRLRGILFYYGKVKLSTYGSANSLTLDRSATSPCPPYDLSPILKPS